MNLLLLRLCGLGKGAVLSCILFIAQSSGKDIPELLNNWKYETGCRYIALFGQKCIQNSRGTLGTTWITFVNNTKCIVLECARNFDKSESMEESNRVLQRFTKTGNITIGSDWKVGLYCLLLCLGLRSSLSHSLPMFRLHHATLLGLRCA